MNINSEQAVKPHSLEVEVPEKVQTICFDGVVIESRSEDNYINATQMCKAGGRRFNDWTTLKTTSCLVATLGTDTGIPVSSLIAIKKGGNKVSQGSWVHPDLAVQLAQWISPLFALQVSRWNEKTKADECRRRALKKIQTIRLNEVVIESRDGDNYINATQMCKAGGREFRDWNRLDATKALIKELSSDVHICTSLLIDVKKGNTSLTLRDPGSTPIWPFSLPNGYPLHLPFKCPGGFENSLLAEPCPSTALGRTKR